MRVALVTGSLPPAPCGVGDFTQKLAEGLIAAGVQVSFVTNCDWSLRRTSEVIKRIERSNADVVHIQYPTRGFARQLGPHAISLALPTVVTLHEFSQVHPLRSISAMAFFVRSEMIFTTEYERDAAQRWAPWIRHRSTIVPIASNIEPFHGPAPARQGIAYFGLLRPNRGIEEFLQLARLLQRDRESIPMKVIGKEVEEFREYFASIRDSASDVRIGWHINQAEERVSQLLSSSEFAYLHFPEGATERRTSLIAAMVNGCAVISNSGLQTPVRLLEVLAVAPNPQLAADSILQLRTNPEAKSALIEKQMTYARQFNLDEIVQAHIRVYSRVLARSSDAQA